MAPPTPAEQLEAQILDLVALVRRAQRVARLALYQCLRTIDGEDGDAPEEWRRWRIELDLVRGNLDVPSTNDAMRQPRDGRAARGRAVPRREASAGGEPRSQRSVLDHGHAPTQQLGRRVKERERLKDPGNAGFKLVNAVSLRAFTIFYCFPFC